jgi:hypothetical protein
MSDDKISPEFQRSMNDMAEFLDSVFNGSATGKDKKNAFVLLLMPFDGPPGQRVNYIANAGRKEVITMMKEVIARFEGQPEIKGKA